MVLDCKVAGAEAGEVFFCERLKGTADPSVTDNQAALFI